MKSIPSLANVETDPAVEPDFIGTASYCMEDDKLRLYVGRVPREDYLALKNEGWTSTPKQSCDFVATWTPERNRTILRPMSYTWQKVPAGTFRSEGTNIPTILLSIIKP
jgi:hypothetical protein